MGVIQLVINGTTQFSTMVAQLVEMEGNAKVLAFTTLSRYITVSSIRGKKVVPFEELGDLFDKNSIRILNTIGYSKMNTVRERVNKEIADSGFLQYSYISNRAFIAPPTTSELLSSGCIIMPNVFVGPDVIFGKSVVVYNIATAH